MTRVWLWLAMLLGLAPLTTSAASAPATPPIFAVVIGIDRYDHLPPLQGAVNDANAIARSLRTIGAREVVTLIDRQASRAAIVAAIQAMGQKAGQAGGWLVISYAGHGGQEPERVRGDEADGKDEVLLLSGFSTGPSGNGERLVDNDIYTLLSAVPRNVQIIFIADACHSGTLTRSIDARAQVLGTRLARYGPITADTLPPPPPASIGRKEQDLPNLVYVSSARDDEVTPEFLINGIPHGALSWHMARAFAGEADLDRNGVTELSELRAYMVNSVRLIAENRQTPGVTYLAGRDRDAAPARGGGGAVAARPEDAAVRIFVLGNRPLPSLRNAAAAPGRAQADLVWDTRTGEVVANGTGDRIAQQKPGQADDVFLAGVVQKMRALALLRPAAARRSLPIAIGPSGAGVRYAGGTIDISLQPGDGPRFVTLFNIAGDGTVQMLYPAPRRASEAAVQPAGATIRFASAVQPPFGADHVVALASVRDPARLRERLMALDGQVAPYEAARAVLDAADDGTAVGLVGIFTGPD